MLKPQIGQRVLIRKDAVSTRTGMIGDVVSTYNGSVEYFFITFDSDRTDGQRTRYYFTADELDVLYWVEPDPNVRWRNTCYSDHNEDLRTKGSCDYCGGTK